MSAWKPPERVWVWQHGWTHKKRGKDFPYIPESVALERERVLREALEDLVDQVIEYDAYGRQESPDLTKARAALDSQGGEG